MAFLLALQMFSLLPPHSRPLFNALIVLSFFVDIFLYFFLGREEELWAWPGLSFVICPVL